MDSIMVISIMAGFMVVIIISLISAIVLKAKKMPLEAYDERQLLIRGNGFKYGFFSVMICNLMLGVLLHTGLFSAIAPYIGFLVSVMIGFLVFMSYCIWNDAYLTRNARPMSFVIVFGIIGLSNLLMGATHIMDGSVLETELDKNGLINLICGVIFIIVATVALLKELKNKKEERAQEGGLSE